MGKRTIIPYGPQHPVLPEPIHLDLVLEDETVVEAIPRIGYIHRGLEKLVEKKEFLEYVYVAERICGICSFMHGMGYCLAVEKIMDIEVPRRGEYLRTMWCELSRIHSHLLWLGLLADALGFESLFMHSWRMREKILDIFDMTTGGRIIFSVCKIGGVRRDVDSKTLLKIKETLKESEKELTDVTGVFLSNKSVTARLSGLGVLSKEEAINLGAVGPMARASGVEKDLRRLNYAAYSEINFKTITDSTGDCLARVRVRIKEIFESLNIIYQCIDNIPVESEIFTPVKGAPNGEFFARLEQPRGEVLYYVKGSGSKFLERMRVRTPTFANLPSLLYLLQNAKLSDVALLVLTIDPCVSCAER